MHTLALTFNEMIERLEKDFIRQRRFVSDASHELRTPVAAIRSLTDVALSQENGTGGAGGTGGTGGAGVSSDEYLSTLRDVNAEAERLGHLINDLLALARTDENQLLLEREAVRLDLLAADVVATTEALASEKGIALEVKADQPATVIGDEVRLIQVMMNLIDNAIAYTNRGGKVLLSVEVRERSVYLIVRDSGIGIAQEHLEHIFERFYRVDAARSRAAGGSGLGLAIVEWIVRAHDGAISVESEIGKGTTFTVRLPLGKMANQRMASARIREGWHPRGMAPARDGTREGWHPRGMAPARGATTCHASYRPKCSGAPRGCHPSRVPGDTALYKNLTNHD